MKAAVFSDTHGRTELMIEAARRCRPDILIHLGDCERDADELRREFPDTPLYSVCGNCDLAAISPLCETVPMGPVTAFICHGHSYHVKYSLDSLVYAAQEQQAKIAMFGHTHMPFNEDIDGVRVINPGSAGMGRRPSFALVEVFDNGGIYCEIKEL
jgi:putative phosphoesterase